MSNKNEIGIADITPKFLEKEEKIKGSHKGTLMHLFLQKIDFSKEYDLNILYELKEELTSKGIISNEENNAIDVSKVMKFIESDLYKKIKSCKKIEKEKAFCMKMSINDIFSKIDKEKFDYTKFFKNISELEKEYILVQGIIDLYGITENDEVILVDYKTDYIQDEELLKDRYKNQLIMYKSAIEKALNKKVTNMYIYSLHLNKEIII